MSVEAYRQNYRVYPVANQILLALARERRRPLAARAFLFPMTSAGRGTVNGI